jgi:dihydropteroate synthase
VQSKTFITNKTLNVGGRLIDLSIPKVMGILNTTPDSFYNASRVANETALLKQAEKMLHEGATFLDVGGYSSRPGASDVLIEDEISRTSDAIKVIVKEFPEANVSIDSFRSEVARIAVSEGAVLVNDISGGQLDSKMFETVANLQVPYVLMHMRGNPQTMNSLTTYDNLLKDLTDYFHQKIHTLESLGVKDIILDPGFGFAKTLEQNFEILQHLQHFHTLDKPILVGLSRKSMITKVLGTTAEDALNGTTALNTAALLKDAKILRVHDVKEAMEAVKLVSAINTKS